MARYFFFLLSIALCVSAFNVLMNKSINAINRAEVKLMMLMIHDDDDDG